MAHVTCIKNAPQFITVGPLKRFRSSTRLMIIAAHFAKNIRLAFSSVILLYPTLSFPFPPQFCRVVLQRLMGDHHLLFSSKQKKNKYLTSRIFYHLYHTTHNRDEKNRPPRKLRVVNMKKKRFFCEKKKHFFGTN